MSVCVCDCVSTPATLSLWPPLSFVQVLDIRHSNDDTEIYRLIISDAHYYMNVNPPIPLGLGYMVRVVRFRARYG